MEDTNEILKRLAFKAVAEFDEVVNKCQEYQVKLVDESKKRKTLEAQFKQLKQASLLAITEYESLHKQYVDENKYRQEVENNLNQVKNENVQIRKQHSISQTATIVQNDDNTGNLQGTKGELELLRSLNKGVNDELRKTKSDLTITKDQLKQEKEAHESLKKNMAMHVEQNRQLNRVSVMALNEFNELKKKYEIEVELRKEAEDIATKAVAEKNLDDRKSRMISMHVENNEQLDVYMKEIDELNALSEQYKRESEKKIKELEEQISSSEDTQSVTALEERLALVMDQLELAQNQLVEAEERSTKAEENSRQLYSRLAQAERGRTSSVVLPPPPPPPPPPIAAPVIRKFIIRIGKRKKDGNTVDIAGQEEDPRIQAMSEMMDRIKKGVGLRPVNSPVKVGDKDEEDGSAMNELAGLLDKMRKGRSDSKENLADMSETKQPEFIKVKLKKSAKPSFEMESAAAPTSELKKKLEKQKSIAEGLDDSAPATKKKPVPIPQDGKSRSASEIKNETAENNERKKDLDDQVNSPVVSDKDSMTNTQDEKVDITSNDDVKPISQHDEPKEETPTKKPDAEPENITNETNGKQENVVKQPDSEVENDIKEMNNKGSTSDSVDAKEKLETSDNLIERKEENDNKKKSIDENLSVSNVRKDGERNSENWEIEMVIDATKRQTSDQKVDETPSADVLQREHRKSVDEIFDSMLSDINSSIEKNTDKSS